jgi:hypothetical protein
MYDGVQIRLASSGEAASGASSAGGGMRDVRRNSNVFKPKSKEEN